MAETIKIGGELESMATGKIVAAASAILDKLKNKTQELINQENTSGIQANAEDIASLNSIVASLQQLIDAVTVTGGTVANAVEVFVAAIAGLPANNVQAALGELNDRTGGISKSSTASEDDEIRFETDGGTLVGKVDANGADFINLKRGGQQVARMSDLPTVPTVDTSIGSSPNNSHIPSTKAVKNYVDDNIPEVPEYPIETETTQSGAEEVIFGNDAGTQQYVKVSSEGIRAIAYLDMQGNNVIPVKDTSIGENPSATNVPTTEAVKDYVDENSISGFPISKGTSIASSEKMVIETDEGTAVTELEFAESLSENSDEIIIGDNALTDVYLKIGAYGIKAKAIFDINGNPISNPVDSVDGYPIQASPCSPLLISQGKAAIFKSWSFIGASYESGVVQYQTSGGVASQYADYVHSWPEIFCKLNGVECKYIYAIPGASMNIWCTGTAANGTQYTTGYANRGRGKFENDSAFADAFIVNISSNDFTPNRFNGQIGSPDAISISSYEDNAALNTHCGWLAAIICEIRKKQPRAFIFVATCRKGAGSAAAIEAEIATANKFDNVFVMDMHTYGIDWANNTIKQRYMIGGHPNMNGYVALAHSFNAYVHYIIQNNPIAFREAQFVGTDYHDITNS